MFDKKQTKKHHMHTSNFKKRLCLLILKIGSNSTVCSFFWHSVYLKLDSLDITDHTLLIPN